MFRSITYRDSGTWKPDTLLAVVGLAAATLLFPLRFFVSVFLVDTIPLVLGAASGLYLVITQYGRAGASFSDWRASVSTARMLRAGTLVGLGGMVFVGTVTGGRTVPFILVAAGVGSALLLRILFVPETTLNPPRVLAELVAFSVITRGIALVTTPGLIGVDTWTHVTAYAHSIQQSGHLSAISTVKYYAAPLYHLLIVVAAELFGSSLRTALYATVGVGFSVSIALVYMTTQYFVSVRWALVAAALYTVSNHVVHWGIDLIPTSLGLVFFLAVFYGTAKLYTTETRRPLYALVVFFAVAVVLTHQVSAFITLAFLGAGALVHAGHRYLKPRLAAGDRYTPVNFIGLFVVVSLLAVGNWTVTPHRGGSFLDRMIGLFSRRFASAGFLDIASASAVPLPETLAGMAITIPLLVEVLNSLGLLLLLFVFLVGLFTLLQHTHLNSLTLTWMLAAAVMLLVTLGTPLVGIYTFAPSRWYAFLYAPMVIIGVFGAQYLTTRLSGRAVISGLVIFALVFPGAMLVSPEATPENPVFEDSYAEVAYTDTELRAADTISGIHPQDTAIQTDQPYRTIFKRWQNRPVAAFNMTDNGTPSAETVVYRRHQTTDVAKVEYRGEKLRVQLPYRSVCPQSGDTVYTAGTVRYCRNA